MIRQRWLVTLIAAGCLATPGTASAALTFGADLTQTPMDDLMAPNPGDPVSGVTTVDSAGMNETGSPLTGVLVSARVKTIGDAVPSLVARVLEPVGIGSVYLNYAPEIPLPVPALPAAAITEVGGLHHPIAIGSLLGLGYEKPANFGISPNTVVAATRYPSPQMAHAPGTTLGYGGTENLDLLVQGTVEPDADGDTFGDESQDQCPGTAGPQNGCPVPATARKRCKKGFRLKKVKTKSGKKKKKCVRKKRRKR